MFQSSGSNQRPELDSFASHSSISRLHLWPQHIQRRQRQTFGVVFWNGQHCIFGHFAQPGPVAISAHGRASILAQSFRCRCRGGTESFVFGGIHWQFDNVAGLKAGAGIADQTFDIHLRKK